MSGYGGGYGGGGYGGPPQGYGGPPPQGRAGYGGPPPQGYGGPPQGYGGPPQPAPAPAGYGQQPRPGSAYQRRQGVGGFVAGSTLGPAGSVDFASLARGAGGGLWSDPDFKPGDKALWIDPRQPGGGAIGGIMGMNVSLLQRVLRHCALRAARLFV